MAAHFLCAPSAFSEPEHDIVADMQAAMVAAQETEGTGKPAMWSLSDDDTTIYLFGSVHVLKPGTDWRTDDMNAAFAASDRVVFETYQVEPDGSDIFLMRLFQEGFFRDGTTLKDLLDDEQKSIVDEGLSKIRLSLEAMNGFKPWNVTLSSVVLLAELEGYDAESGVDATLEREANAAGKELLYLETPNDQFNALTAGSTEEQIDALVDMALSIELAPDFLNLMIDEWIDGDITGQETLFLAESSSETMINALLLDRNEKWVPQLIDMLEEPGSVFVVVGAGHLTGEVSVIKMLREQGYDVKGPL